MDRHSINFSKLYCLFILFYLGFTDQWFTDPFAIATLLSSLIYLFFTTREEWFLGVVISFTAFILVLMPNIPNVIFFSLVLNLTLLTHYIRCKLKRITFNISDIRRIVIIGLSVLYLFAFFHKLNYSFLDIDCSCGTFLTKELIEYIPGFALPDAFYHVIIYLTLIIELLLPIGLLLRKTRTAALIFGLVFHFMLARSHYDFSALIFALYALYLPSNITEQISKYINQLTKWPVGILLLASIGFGWYYEYMFSYRLFMGLWFIYALGYLFKLVKALKEDRNVLFIKADSLPPVHIGYQIFPVLLIFNGLNPYLGLKTEYSFAMYSNLRTEAGLSNHLIINEELKLFNFQDDLILIKDTNIPGIEREEYIPYFDFIRLIKKYEGYESFYVKYEYDDKITIYNFDGSINLKEQKYYPLLNKYLKFRKLQLEKQVECLH